MLNVRTIRSCYRTQRGVPQVWRSDGSHPGGGGRQGRELSQEATAEEADATETYQSCRGISSTERPAALQRSHCMLPRCVSSLVMHDRRAPRLRCFG